jgi:hypothetical protein
VRVTKEAGGTHRLLCEQEMHFYWVPSITMDGAFSRTTAETPGSIAAPIIVRPSGIKIPDLSVVKERQLLARKPQTRPRGDLLKI